MLLEMKTADFRFWTSVLLRGIVGPIARKRYAGQVPKDAFSARQAFFRHTLIIFSKKQCFIMKDKILISIISIICVICKSATAQSGKEITRLGKLLLEYRCENVNKRYLLQELSVLSEKYPEWHAVILINELYSGEHTSESFANYISEKKSFNNIPFENKTDISDEIFFKEYINYIANDNVLFYLLGANYYVKISISIDEKVDFKNKFEKQIEWIKQKSNEKSKYKCSNGFSAAEERLSKLKEGLVKEMKQYIFDSENNSVISILRERKDQVKNPNKINEKLYGGNMCFFIYADFFTADEIFNMIEPFFNKRSAVDQRNFYSIQKYPIFAQKIDIKYVYSGAYTNYAKKPIEEAFEWAFQTYISEIDIWLVSGNHIYIKFPYRNCQYVNSWTKSDTITDPSAGLFKDNLLTGTIYEFKCKVENLENLFQLESKIENKLSSINQSILLKKHGEFKQPLPNFRFGYYTPIGSIPKTWVKEFFGNKVEYPESSKTSYTLGKWERNSIISSDVHDPEKNEIKIECNGKYIYAYIGRDLNKSTEVYSAGTNICEDLLSGTRFQTLEDAINHTIKCVCKN